MLCCLRVGSGLGVVVVVIERRSGALNDWVLLFSQAQTPARLFSASRGHLSLRLECGPRQRVTRVPAVRESLQNPLIQPFKFVIEEFKASSY